MFKNKHLGRVLKALPLAVAATGLMIATSAPVKAGDVKSWQKAVVTLISKKQVYPRAALADAIEGRAKVQVSIDRSGAITSYNITESTGNAVLDEEVPKLMSRIDPLPKPPSELSDDNLTFILPLSWVLE